MEDAEHDKMMRGWLTLFAFSGSMNKKGMFKGMLEDVIAKPSWLRMLFNPSMSIGFGKDQWPTREEAWTPSSGSSLATLKIPLALEIAGKPALQGEMLAAEPAAPLSLAGGLVRASGHRPDAPDVRVDIWLMGAARGSGGREFKAATR